jgi:hypothetical protein
LKGGSMGRATPSFREKYRETVEALRSELVELLRKERREAFEKLEKVWNEELGAISNCSNPYILGSLLLVALLDLERKVEELERRMGELEGEACSGG